MATINPFYRFEDAPEVASIGEGAVRTSEFLDACGSDLQASTFTGNNIGLAYGIIKSVVDFYNGTFANNFLIKQKTIPQVSSGIHLVEFLVYDEGLQSLYSMSGVNIVLEVNTDQIIGQFVNNFGVVPSDFDYGTPLYDGERAAHDALLVNYNSGGAVFPSWYSFDSTTGVATSYIARFKNCKYDSALGRVVRVPADTKPRGVAIKKRSATQSVEGKYILALFDQLINAAVNGASYNDLSILRNSLVAPSGYIINYYFEISPSERQQINIYKPSGEGYALIIRESSGIKFQRFYAPSVLSVYDIIDNTDGNDPLPYPPNDGISYGGVWFDYEQIQFQDACSIPVENYPMPAKSGDQMQFNIESDSGNVLTDALVSIGLFDEEFNFVQRIGSAETREYVCPECAQPIVFTKTYAEDLLGWNNLRLSINAAISDPATYNFGLYFGSGNTKAQTLLQETPASVLTNDAQFKTYIEDLSTLDYLVSVELVPSGDETYPNYGIVTITTFALDCQIEPYDVQFGLSLIETPLEAPFENTFTQTGGQNTITTSQNHFASITIPPVSSGCYRLGLYQFGYDISAVQTSWAQQTWFPTFNNCIAIIDNLGNVKWLITIPKGLANWAYFTEWLKANKPFGIVDIDLTNNFLTYTVNPYIDMFNWTMEIGLYDFNSGVFYPQYTVDEQAMASSLYDQNINEIYSFSNLLNLDDSDCFSTILEFWGEDGSLAQGFEYFNNWKQRIRLGINGGGKKPIITESLYRQSNGVHKRPQNKQDLSVDLHTDFLDFETQSALVDATRHPYFVWNGQNLFVTGDIEVATNQDFTTQSSFEDLAQVKFSALVQGFQPKNSTCINC